MEVYFNKKKYYNSLVGTSTRTKIPVSCQLGFSDGSFEPGVHVGGLEVPV